MAKKKILVNGKWVFVEETEIKDVAEDEDEEEGTDKDVDEDESEEDEKMMRQAKKIGKTIADQLGKEIDIDGQKAINARVEKILGLHFGEDSKLKAILGGKDVYEVDKLTKEEKIVGFFHALVSNNTMALKALSEGVNADGGFLFPKEFLNELVQELPQVNVMRNYVRVIPMRRNKMDITSLVNRPKVYWTAENAAKTTTTAAFSQTTLTAYKMAAILYSSDELIEDSDITDVVNLIISLFAEAVGIEEQRVIWNGTGTGQPTGIDTARSAGTIAGVAVAGNGTADDLKALYYRLPVQYRNTAAWFMNDGTASQVDKLKDSNNRYLWQDSIAAGSPPTLLGKPVVIVNDVPTRQIYFGDMKRAYFLGDRKSMTAKVSNDTETAFTHDQTAIRVVARIGGLVVLGNAVKAITGF